MIGIFILAVVVVAIASAVGYSLVTEIRTGEMISMAGRNAPRMDAAVSAVAASARPLAGGQPVVPAPSSDASGRSVLPTWVSTEGASPWGVPYGYCPYAVPDRPDLAAQPSEAVGGQGEKRPIATVPMRAEGTERPFVVVGARAPRADDEADAPTVAAFVLSPIPGSQSVPDCGSVVWKGGRYRVVGEVPGIVSVLSIERLRDSATGLGAVTRWAAAGGSGDGRTRGEPAPLSAVLAEWRSVRPTRTVVRLVGQGPHVLSADDLDLLPRNGGREGSLSLVSDKEGRALLAGPPGGARVDVGIDLSLAGVTVSNALGLTVRGGGRLVAVSSTLRHLLLDGGDAVLGAGADILLDPLLDPGAAARVRGGTLALEEAQGSRKILSAGAGRPAVALQGGTLIVNGSDLKVDAAANWAAVENGGRISALPRYVGGAAVTPTVLTGAGEIAPIRSRLSFGPEGGAIDDAGIEAGIVQVSETCEAASCSATCPADRRILSGDCEGSAGGWALRSFGTGGSTSSWSCAWIPLSANAPVQQSTARATCARLR
ncbi:hypothetical protein BHAOGJBA_1147 [Methylobacterium hispanicum]|uniref:Uncharacterized protein n=1 Tax=Methylobacterium hispanicum TaxID=270350 RepID=A0AAV4ZHG0_9HYPH|nr:hypothetical protein [Methylobacterium hispanicum]GJD87642.1 hypothetical protein BHAOGJBA_1147 [Methylobacterium hispanicum]